MRPLQVHPGTRVLVICPSCKGEGATSFTPREEGGPGLDLKVPCGICEGNRTLWAVPASQVLFEGKVLPKGWRNVFHEALIGEEGRLPQYSWMKWAKDLPSERVVVLDNTVRIVGVGERRPRWRIDYWSESERKWRRLMKPNPEEDGHILPWLTDSFTRALIKGRETLEGLSKPPAPKKEVV